MTTRVLVLGDGIDIEIPEDCILQDGSVNFRKLEERVSLNPADHKRIMQLSKLSELISVREGRTQESQPTPSPRTRYDEMRSEAVRNVGYGMEPDWDAYDRAGRKEQDEQDFLASMGM